MAFCELHWFSEILGRQTTTWVLLPDTGERPFKTLYLLHGLSDDHTMWMRRSRVEVYASKLPLIVVMPDGGRGFYTDHHQGPKWAEHIGVELPTMIERTFPAEATRAGRCIGGLSMGGYGALRIALGYPDRFSSANSHSGAVQFGSRPSDVPERAMMVGPSPRGSDHHLLTLAERAKTQLPRLLIDCGVDDFLTQDNREFHRELTAAEVPHEYREFPGGHTWEYWDEHVPDALAFHMGMETRT